MMRNVIGCLMLAAVVMCAPRSQESVQCNDSHCSCVSKDGRNLGFSVPLEQSQNKNCECAVAQDTYRQTGLVGKTFNCDQHGNFAPVRCHGSVCSCVDAHGQNIGYQTHIADVADKNCQCAVDEHAFEQTGMLGQTFDCDEKGNYSPVRCQGSVCFCVDAFGRDLGFHTSIGQAYNMNCKCAIEQDAYKQTGMLGKTHRCDKYGNYSPVQCLGSVCHCADVHGRDLGYPTSIGLASTKTCQCAIDKDAYQQLNVVGKTFNCDEHGNYNPIHCTGSVCTCVDAYGKPTTSSTVHISEINSLNC